MYRAGVIALLAGCLGGTEVREDVGEVCLFGSEPGAVDTQTTFEAGAPIHVRYALSTQCLPCGASDAAASCSITGDASGFAVTSHVSWNESGSLDTFCPAICIRPWATCSTEALGAGTYTFTFADETVAAALPGSESEAPCATSD